MLAATLRRNVPQRCRPPRGYRPMSSAIQFPGPSGSQPNSSIGEPSRPTEPLLPHGSSNSNSNSNSLVPSITTSPQIPPVSETQAHPYAGAKEYADNQEAKNPPPNSSSNLPALPQHDRNQEWAQTHVYNPPPFDTHHFFSALVKTFPAPTANSLMRATRALLVDRLGRVRREALTSKDLENQAYLFRAALSEARNEITLRQKNDSATILTTSSTLRREIDTLDGKMKSDIANLKHELQMDVDNRKTESKTDLKQMDIAIEDVLNKAIVQIGDMRAKTEEMKWDNMRRAVLGLGVFAVTIIIIFETNHSKTTKEAAQLPALIPSEPRQSEFLEEQMT